MTARNQQLEPLKDLRGPALEAHPELKTGTEAPTALGRIGQPADVADAVAFLASYDARWITGQVIDVSGGTFLGPTGLRNMMSAPTGK
jgi:NAD(P)-dependent dehydrogenase (short-subunit alcohol dehydrogenase family)